MARDCVGPFRKKGVLALEDDGVRNRIGFINIREAVFALQLWACLCEIM